MHHELIKGKLKEALDIRIPSGTIHVPVGEEVIILIAWTGEEPNKPQFFYSTGGSENYVPDDDMKEE